MAASLSASRPPSGAVAGSLVTLAFVLLYVLVFHPDEFFGGKGAARSDAPNKTPASGGNAVVGGYVAPAASCPPAVPAMGALLQFAPDIKKLIINIGANRNPPVPKDGDTAVLAIEPVPQTAMTIPQHPRIYVVTAAISNVTGFASFFTYNEAGETSSLSAMPEEYSKDTKLDRWWAWDSKRPDGMPPVLFVPVLTLTQLLDTIPQKLRIVYLKTDMQGYDYTAISAVERSKLRRVEQIYAEVTQGGFSFNPNAPNNDINLMEGMMRERGYVAAGNDCPPRPVECNGRWVRDDLASQLPGLRDFLDG